MKAMKCACGSMPEAIGCRGLGFYYHCTNKNCGNYTLYLPVSAWNFEIKKQKSSKKVNDE